MKQYVYNQSASFAVLDTVGERFDLKQFDIIFTYDEGKTFSFTGHSFVIPRDKLKENFLRVYTVEEQNRYDRIYENAMVSAMQSLIANMKDKTISDMCDVENVPKNAIWFADKLVEELKGKEF